MYKNLSVVFLFVLLCFGTSRSNGLPQSGLTGPALVAKVVLQNQTAPIPTTAMYTPSVSGLYRVSAYMTGPADDTNNSWTLNLQWFDEQGRELISSGFLTRQGAAGPPDAFAVIPGLTGHAPGGVAVVQSVAGQSISYSVEGSQRSYGGSYSLFITIERLI